MHSIVSFFTSAASVFHTGQCVQVGTYSVQVVRNLAEGAYGFVDEVIEARTKKGMAMKRVLAQVMIVWNGGWLMFGNWNGMIGWWFLW